MGGFHPISVLGAPLLHLVLTCSSHSSLSPFFQPIAHVEYLEIPTLSPKESEFLSKELLRG